jgi:Gly-Xaa carboxypeptidase
MDRFIDITLPVAVKHNMTLEAFGKTVGSQGPLWGTIRIHEAFNSSLVPSPVTPTTGSGPYELLSGTIRSTFQTHLRTDGLPTTAVVSPGLSTGEFHVSALPYNYTDELCCREYR